MTPDLLTPDRLRLTPSRAITPYIDGFGNKCVQRSWRRTGQSCAVACDTIVAEQRQADRVDLAARAACRRRPAGTKACSSCLPAATARSTASQTSAGKLFGTTPPGWARVQAICDFVHQHIALITNARPTRTALEAFRERTGVCRDYTHLAITLLPLHEHSGALLHRLPWRHRRAAAAPSDGFQRLV